MPHLMGLQLRFKRTFAMKILAVFAHPSRKSFTGALLDEFVGSATSAGHSVDVLDLTGEGFDPCYNMDDLAVYGGVSDVPEDIALQQKRINDADAIAFFFPIWWWSMPAILKGWIDRVFSNGFAFSYDDAGNLTGLLKHQKVALFCPAASDQGLYRRYGYHAAFQRQIDAGIFGYCGIKDVETYLFPEADDNEDARKNHLAHTREIATSFDEVKSLSSRAFS